MCVGKKEEARYYNSTAILCTRYFLLAYHSTVKALVHSFPNMEIFPWTFEDVPKYFWKSKLNQQTFMMWLMGELGYESMEDWYLVTVEDIRKHGGSSLLDGYRCSPSFAL